MGNQALLIDGSSLLVRAYFATAYQGRPKRSSSGHFTNGVSGFLNMMFSAIRQLEPRYLFVAWDVSRDTFRRELYPAYKGTRGELPDELLTQFDLTREVLSAMGVMQHQDERYEADDLIGTMSVQGAVLNMPVQILTGDKDALQLVSEQVSVLIMKKGITELIHFTPETLYREMGLHAHQITDFKGLMGDTSDNIPGVPGIGEKTAKKILQEHQNIESLYSAIDEERATLSEKMRQKLLEHRELALLSKKLATIVTEVDIPHRWEQCGISFTRDRAQDKLRELELSRFLKVIDEFGESAS